MDKHDFIHLYWKNYITIEKEFSGTLDYIALNMDNYDVFSPVYIKILLQVGSEIDIVAKLLCEHYDSSIKVNNIDEYRIEIMKRECNFGNIEIEVLQSKDNLLIKPWEAWGRITNNGKGENPSWWKVYNKVKHERNSIGTIDGRNKEYYKFANLKYTLFSLAGLYQLLIYYYFDLAQGERVEVPLPGSRLFLLTGGKWNNIIFYQDIALYVDDSDGHLYSVSGEFAY